MKKRLHAILGLVLVLTAWAGPSTDSPFMPDGASGGQAPVAGPGGPVEFCGVLNTEAGTYFGLYEPGKQKGQWLALNQTGGEYVVRGYDSARRVLTVEGRGQVQTLALKEPKLNGPAAPVVAMAAPPVPGVQAGAGGAPADEALRLQAVAEEVRRRRAMRKAAEAGGQAPAPRPGDPEPKP